MTADKGTLSRARRINREVEKLLALMEDGKFVGVQERSIEALKFALDRSRMCAANVLTELVGDQVYR